MADSQMNALSLRLAEEGRARFPRWDDALWDQILVQPAAALAAALGDDGAASPLVASYLELAAEAVGLGYLYPSVAIDRDGFFTFAWFDLLPRLLPQADPARRAALLAACWNLGENLEHAQPWLQRVLLTELRGLADLDQLEPTVNAAVRAVTATPERPLDAGACAVHLISLAEGDPRFLPGRIDFVAPTVVCVHDRHKGLDDEPRASVGVWLSDPPLFLGPMRPPAAVMEGDLDEALWQAVMGRDPRVTDVFDAVRNPWRGAATLQTSQLLVVAMPG